MPLKGNTLYCVPTPKVCAILSAKVPAAFIKLLKIIDPRFVVAVVLPITPVNEFPRTNLTFPELSRSSLIESEIWFGLNTAVSGE